MEKRGRQKKSAALAALGPIPNEKPETDAAMEKRHNTTFSPPPENNAVAYGCQSPSPTDKRRVTKDRKNAWTIILTAALDQIQAAFQEERRGIEEAYRQAIEEGDDESDKKKKYTFGASISVSGDDPDHYSVDVKLSYGIKKVNRSSMQVAVGKDLVDLANDAAEHDLASGRDGHGYPELRTESAVKDVVEEVEDEEVVDL
jgi:hypothetical protein